jgi:hypothetical protein
MKKCSKQWKNIAKKRKSIYKIVKKFSHEHTENSELLKILQVLLGL